MRFGFFKDRRTAGRILAESLADYAHRSDVVVLALPRGGVPVAYEVAQVLEAPLDVLVVRKLGVPFHEEFAMGAIATGGVEILNAPIIQQLHISTRDIHRVIQREKKELERREQRYHEGRSFLNVRGYTVILVDDGLATGSTMQAAVKALRTQQPAQIIIAVPTAAPDACEELRGEVNEVIATITPEPFGAVGRWYESFPQVSDEEVCQLLAQAATPLARAS